MAVPKNAPSGKGKGTVPPGAFGGKPGASNKAGADERLRARVEGKVMSSEEAADLLKKLEAQLAALRNKHEQYFLGLDRQAPDHERASLKKQIDDLKFLVGRNTALKFGVQSLFNRFLSYERMWLRTEQDIEEGRYTRDLFKARLRSRKRRPDETDPHIHLQLPGGPNATAAAPSPSSTLAAAPAAPASTDKPAQPPPLNRPPAGPATAIPRAPTAVPRAGTAPPGMIPSEDKLRAVYQAYVSAKKQCKEPTAGMSFEQVADQLRKQVPQILQQTKAKAIDFKVVIKDGKATLRAVPKD